MKMCWDNIENLVYTKSGKFRTGYDQNTYRYYEERDHCKNCGNPYLMPVKRPSDFCSKSCCQMGEYNHNYGVALSKERKRDIGRHSAARNCGRNHPQWKGGVTADGTVTFDTYAGKLSFCEDVRRHPKKYHVLQVRCYLCKDWFSPSRSAVKNRLHALEDTSGRECHFYCSNTCKNSCGVYNRTAKLPIDNSQYSHAELITWRKEVLERANNACEFCGCKATVAHHIIPKKIQPFLALDPDNGVACCKKCHNKYGHSDECSTGNIASIRC